MMLKYWNIWNTHKNLIMINANKQFQKCIKVDYMKKYVSL